MTALWLFLYLACIVRAGALYTLDSDSPTVFALLLPVLFLPLSAWLKGRRPGIFVGWPLRAAGLVALAAAFWMTRTFHLDFWDTNRWQPAIVLGLLGFALQWVAVGLKEEGQGAGLWLWVAFWEYTGGWHPLLPLLGAGLGACLMSFQVIPQQSQAKASARTLGPWPAFLLLGFALPKPAWDYLLDPAWAKVFTLFAMGVALALTDWVRRWGLRLPGWALLVATGLLGFVYPSALAWIWGLVLGIVAGWIWVRLPRPIPLASLTWAFLLGMTLSFAFHANAGRPILRSLLWIGS